MAGKELVRYSIEAALNSTILDEIVLNSDDKDILKIGSEYQRITCLKRPKEISDDSALAISYVNHTLEVLRSDYDYITIIQPTSPFTIGMDIDNTINLLHNNHADSAVSIVKLDHAIHPIKLKLKRGLVLEPFLEDEGGRMAAQDLPELYVRNCSVYVSSIDTIRAGKIIGDRCLGYEMPRKRSLDINDPVDFEFAEFLMAKHNRNV